LEDALTRHKGNLSAVAREVGRCRATVYKYVKRGRAKLPADSLGNEASGDPRAAIAQPPKSTGRMLASLIENRDEWAMVPKPRGAATTSRS
jgi:hypothetical protein